jgi:hypothetical protein
MDLPIGELMNLLLCSCMAGLLVLRFAGARPATVARASAAVGLDEGEPPAVVVPDPTAGPAYCVVGPTLCRIRVWTESEWAELPEGDRPATREHVPGLGWVGAVPEVCLN